MYEQHGDDTTQRDRHIASRWAWNAFCRHWLTALWAVVWIVAVTYTTTGIAAPTLLLGLLLLTLDREKNGGGRGVE